MPDRPTTVNELISIRTPIVSCQNRAGVIYSMLNATINDGTADINNSTYNDAADRHYQNYAHAVIQRAQNSNKAEYEKDGGIKNEFSKQAPNEIQRDNINSFIANNLDGLRSVTGLNINDIFLELPADGDIISCEDFDPTSKTEWRLLSKTPNKYIFITANSAEGLIDHGNKHPLIAGEMLTTASIVRRPAMLDLLGSAYAASMDDSQQLLPMLLLTLLQQLSHK